MSENVLILKVNDPEPGPEFLPIRKTRRLKYYKKPDVDLNAMDIQQLQAVGEEQLNNWEDIFLGAFNNMNLQGGKRKSKKSRRAKRKGRKSRKN